MAKITLQTVTQYEYDTETNRTRILKAYTTTVGKDSKAPKNRTITLKTEESEVEYL